MSADRPPRPHLSEMLAYFVRFSAAIEEIHHKLFTEASPRRRAELMHTASGLYTEASDTYASWSHSPSPLQFPDGRELDEDLDLARAFQPGQFIDEREDLGLVQAFQHIALVYDLVAATEHALEDTHADLGGNPPDLIGHGWEPTDQDETLLWLETAATSDRAIRATLLLRLAHHIAPRLGRRATETLIVIADTEASIALQH